MTATGRVAAGLIVLLIAALGETRVTAHSGLRFASPLEGSTLGVSPTHVQLAFIERPEPSLATIRVSDLKGQTYQIGQPELLSDDPLTLRIAVRELPRGVYLVNWRVVSAVDGHATAGAFAFGVQVAPTGPPPTVDAQTSASSIEIAGRVLFLTGLIVVIGAATYQLLRLGDARWMRFAGAGIVMALAGLAVLIAAQSRTSNAGLAALMGTAIGRAWIARAAAMSVAIIGLAFAGVGSKRSVQQLGAAIVWLAACGAIAIHAFSGHAAAGRFAVAPTVIVHAIHVVAAGMWIGGLAILIVGLRNSVEGGQVRALTRFSRLAAIGLALVTITGVARSLQEVGTWDDLTTNTYGALVIAKVLLLFAIAGLGAVNRWRHLPAAAGTMQPLRRTAISEIGLALVAVVIAGALSTLPPPAAANALPGIEVSGTDFATTVKATLTAVSNLPGPNRFALRIEDYDSGAAISPDRASLRFSPIDDAGIPSTTLALTKEVDGRFTATGANLAFDGRWRVDVLMERGSSSVDVPLEIEARGSRQRMALVRASNEERAYRIEASREATVFLRADPETRGQNTLHIWFHNVLFEPLTVTNVVATVQRSDGPVQPLVISRVDRHRVTSTAVLERGLNRVVVIARTETGSRIRATFELRIPNGG